MALLYTVTLVVAAVEEGLSKQGVSQKTRRSKRQKEVTVKISGAAKQVKLQADSIRCLPLPCWLVCNPLPFCIIRTTLTYRDTSDESTNFREEIMGLNGLVGDKQGNYR
jgi:hypothetical protein